LVVDDGSPDDLAAALRPYGERITLVSKSNGGAASARNAGLDRARGEFVAFLDADDYWEHHKLEHLLSVLRKHPQIGLAASRWYTQVPGEARVPPATDEAGDFDRVLTVGGGRALSVSTRILTSTVVVRRSAVGSHRFTPGLEPVEDRDMWVRLVTAAPAYIAVEPLVTYVLEPGSLSRTNVDRDYGNMLRVVRRYRHLLGRREIRRWEAETFRRWAGRYIGCGQPRAAFRPAWQRVLKEPMSLEGWWIVLKTALRASTAWA
jgi:glycosyltransferase involved in cell wall biosynthesis